MTPFQTIQQTLAPELLRLNDSIHKALQSPNELMNRVISTYLEKKGKQIRPILVLLSAKLHGPVNDNAIAGAVAVELLHNASLIHDDVVDDTEIRRGTRTINGAWDNHMAVLIGDFFLSNALLQGVETNDIRVLRSLSELGRLLSIGELDEIYAARYNDYSEEAYFNIIYRKTASLFVSCVEIGAYSGDPHPEHLPQLREFARLLGLAFQIKDDVFDYFADEKIGKPTGNDLREGKITLPLLHALGKTDAPGCMEMRQMAHSPELDAEQIRRLTAFAIDNGGIDYAYQTMRDLRNRAAEQLAVFPDSDVKQAFLSLFDFIINRDN